MRHIEESNSFKKQRRRIENGGNYRKIMQARFKPALIALANDIPLDYSYRDHALIGSWEGYRECHIAFDLILVYALIGDDMLILERIGSHAEIFGL